MEIHRQNIILGVYQKKTNKPYESSNHSLLPGENDFSKTFVIYNEGHTLGNPLKHIIVHPEVTFCGYTIPHPMEQKIHFRIQCTGKPAAEILRQGLKDLKKLNEEILVMLKSEIKNELES
ncbi:putative DNA-directed RNA polymerases I and III subunit RPAC2 [Armadillidium nasatum]|uniref:DNA-directed RNA polymerase I subunit D n=1 Tax=Armadillidium nasatum TaxID=96803 RepID=A0A5N5SUE0_9CRUS|nr:putative DNA-directed RNA polymerases I and III subunit RPAC2 [Armadillidium nasatum]